MTAVLATRPYQEECLTYTELALRDKTAVANVLPTGAGKTVIFAHMTQRHLRDNPGGRVLVLVHTDELVSQAEHKIRTVAPDLEVGVVKAERDETTARAIVASVQTLRSPLRRARLAGVTLIIIDECHHATAKSYRDIVEHYRGSWCKVVGFTATLARSDEADLSKIWEGVAYRKDILWMIENRYLIDVKGIHVKVDDLDLKKVRKSGGDFAEGSLGQALSDSMAPEVVAKALWEHGPDRQTICFTPLVATAYDFADAFTAEGFTAEVVHGALPPKERRAILARYSRGETQILCNAMVLTEGFDAPATSCIIVARPTKSKPLFQQMVGRGLRVDPRAPWEEQDCLVLIVAGAEAHDLRSLVDLTEKQIRPKPDQTLLEALAEEESGEGGGLPEKAKWKGPVAYKEFDPLMRASKRTWNRTKAGTAFLPAGENYILLLPTADPDAPAGSWDVLWANKKTKQQGRTKHAGLPLDMAMQWGEDEADRHGDKVLNTKKQPWRRTPMSDAQREMLNRMKITPGEGWRKGDASDALENAFASRRIDPMADMYMKHLRTMGMA